MRLERLGVVAVEAAALLDVDLEARALVHAVVARPAQAISDGLERRFAADDSVTSDKV
jgi:hypothetical protein